MYTRYFGLREKPFDLSPDPKFLYLSESHKEAFAYLKYGVKERKSFVVITGEVGTGKTTLLNALLEEMDPEVRRVHLTDPGSTVEDLFYMIKRSLDLPIDDMGKGKLLWALHDFMENRLAENEQVLLIIDEAQNLSPSMLEEVRLLSNLETSGKRLFQIFLVGQQELNVKLQTPELRQLRQRIGVKYHLLPLDLTDTQNYIQHRLEIAGFRGKGPFHRKAIREIYRFSKGYPRLINILCDDALLTAYSRDLKEIKRNIIKEVIKDIEASYSIPRKKRGMYAKAAVVTILVFLSMGLTYGIYRNGSIKGMIPSQLVTWIHKEDRLDKEAEARDEMVEKATQKEQMEIPKEKAKLEKGSEDVAYVTKGKEEIAPGMQSRKDIGIPLKGEEGIMIDTTTEILFDYNDYEIRPQAIEILKKVASVIQRCPEASVIIEGHTDNLGDNESNQVLSIQRAESVKRWLINHAGIEESRLKVKGWGDSKPKALNDTPEGRHKNRRVEITIK
ncbi:MAG TPA: DUF2075 domain-containing protein [Syntrophaceae bacterium]|nr:DUF2075 domain-containing protein [Syntrophaceae bacterium]